MSNAYRRLNYLGKGSYGAALLVELKSNPKQKFVMKEIIIGHLSEEEQAAANREATLLYRMSHSNIVMYIESFVENAKLHIVMEFADGGDLTQAIERRKKESKYWSEDEVMRIFVQICMALSHIHSQNILHRDLKPGNIFLTSKGMVKLGDFGIARVLDATDAQAGTQIGTPYYLSPEICESMPYGRASDVWALGVVLFETLTFELPFSAASLPALVVKIVNSQPDFNKLSCKGYSVHLEDLCRAMMHRDPKERPDIESIVADPFVKQHMSRLLSHTLRVGTGGLEGDLQQIKNQQDAEKEKAAKLKKREKERAEAVAVAAAEERERQKYAFLAGKALHDEAMADGKQQLQKFRSDMMNIQSARQGQGQEVGRHQQAKQGQGIGRQMMPPPVVRRQSSNSNNVIGDSSAQDIARAEFLSNRERARQIKAKVEAFERGEQLPPPVNVAEAKQGEVLREGRKRNNNNGYRDANEVGADEMPVDKVAQVRRARELERKQEDEERERQLKIAREEQRLERKRIAELRRQEQEEERRSLDIIEGPSQELSNEKKVTVVDDSHNEQRVANDINHIHAPLISGNRVSSGRNNTANTRVKGMAFEVRLDGIDDEGVILPINNRDIDGNSDDIDHGQLAAPSRRRGWGPPVVPKTGAVTTIKRHSNISSNSSTPTVAVSAPSASGRSRSRSQGGRVPVPYADPPAIGANNRVGNLPDDSPVTAAEIAEAVGVGTVTNRVTSSSQTPQQQSSVTPIPTPTVMGTGMTVSSNPNRNPPPESETAAAMRLRKRREAQLEARARARDMFAQLRDQRRRERGLIGDTNTTDSVGDTNESVEMGQMVGAVGAGRVGWKPHALRKGGIAVGGGWGNPKLSSKSKDTDKGKRKEKSKERTKSRNGSGRSQAGTSSRNKDKDGVEKEKRRSSGRERSSSRSIDKSRGNIVENEITKAVYPSLPPSAGYDGHNDNPTTTTTNPVVTGSTAMSSMNFTGMPSDTILLQGLMGGTNRIASDATTGTGTDTDNRTDAGVAGLLVGDTYVGDIYNDIIRTEAADAMAIAVPKTEDEETKEGSHTRLDSKLNELKMDDYKVNSKTSSQDSQSTPSGRRYPVSNEQQRRSSHGNYDDDEDDWLFEFEATGENLNLQGTGPDNKDHEDAIFLDDELRDRSHARSMKANADGKRKSVGVLLGGGNDESDRKARGGVISSQESVDDDDLDRELDEWLSNNFGGNDYDKGKNSVIVDGDDSFVILPHRGPKRGDYDVGKAVTVTNPTVDNILTSPISARPSKTPHISESIINVTETDNDAEVEVEVPFEEGVMTGQSISDSYIDTRTKINKGQDDSLDMDSNAEDVADMQCNLAEMLLSNSGSLLAEATAEVGDNGAKEEK